MSYLLDTHTFLWFIAGDNRQLDTSARKLIENVNNRCYLSVASLWEITIKSSLGRLTVPMPITLLVENYVSANHIEVLSITASDLDRLHSLPNHHKDPFDRLIIAQCINNDYTVITKR